MPKDKGLLLRELDKAVYKYDDEEVKKICNKVIDRGLDVKEFIFNSLAKGIQKAGVSYNNGDYAIPELLLCADAMTSGLNILKPYLKVDKSEESLMDKIVIGTVQGDIHYIGKDMVKLMLEANGFIVIDLGVDVNVEKFIEAQSNNNAKIVALSTMMTTTLAMMRDIIKDFKKRQINTKILVGGAVMNREIAESYNADGYGADALAAVEEAKRLIKELNYIK